MDNENSAGKTKKSGTIWIILTIVAFLLAVFFLAHTFINLKRHGFSVRPAARIFTGGK